MNKIQIGMLGVTIFVCSSFSQGVYLKKGQSGFGLASGFQFDNDGKGYALAPAFSIMGYVDIVAGYTRTFLDEKIQDANGVDRDVSGTGYGGVIKVHALKEDDKIPLTVTLGVGFTHGTVDSKALESYDAEVSGNSVIYGLSGSKRLGISNGLYIVPSVGYGFGNTKTKVVISDPTGEIEQEESSNSWDIGFGIGFQKELNDKISIIFDGDFDIDDEGDNHQGIGLAFLFKM